MQCSLRGLLRHLLDMLALVWAAARRRRRDDLKNRNAALRRLRPNDRVFAPTLFGPIDGQDMSDSLDLAQDVNRISRRPRRAQTGDRNEELRTDFGPVGHCHNGDGARR